MNKNSVILGVSAFILLLQTGFTHALAREEFRPTPAPLQTAIPDSMGSWKKIEDGVLLPEVYEMLSPDDVLNRTYEAAADRSQLGLFIAYYRTQLRAKNAHDPKVCLPGSGWSMTRSEILPLPGTPAGTVNYYVVRKGDQQAVVLYWYQNHKQAVAQEQQFRLARIFSTISENRTDMALVRIVVPVAGSGLDAAAAKAKAFAQLVTPPVLQQFPPTPK